MVFSGRLEGVTLTGKQKTWGLQTRRKKETVLPVLKRYYFYS